MESEVSLRLTSPEGQLHEVLLRVEVSPGTLKLKLDYVKGDLGCAPEVVADWVCTYEEPNQFDEGHLDIGQGRRDILIEELRGIGLGSLLMSIAVGWAKTLPDVPVDPIHLARADALTQTAQDRRNRFWEKVGFVFDYDYGGKVGTSRPLRSHSLRDLDGKMSNGWEIEQLDPSPNCS